MIVVLKLLYCDISVTDLCHPFKNNNDISPNLITFPLAATFKQVAQTVAGVHLRDHLVDVVFKLFDENGEPFSFLFILHEYCNVL